MALLESLDPEWGSLLEKAVQVALANPRGEWAMKDNRIFFVLPVSLSFVAMVFWLMQAATEFEPAPALVAPAGAQDWNPTSTSTPTPAPTPKLWYEAPPTPTMQVRWDGADATNKTIYLPYDPSQGHLLD